MKTKIINFTEYKTKREKKQDIQRARKYIYSLAFDSLEMEILESLFYDVQEYKSEKVLVNFSQLSREQQTSVYTIKKAYQHLLDNKVLIEVSKSPRKPVVVSTENLLIVLEVQERKVLN